MQDTAKNKKECSNMNNALFYLPDLTYEDIFQMEQSLETWREIHFQG